MRLGELALVEAANNYEKEQRPPSTLTADFGRRAAIGGTQGYENNERALKQWPHFRLYDPTQGRILVDDHDLRELDPSQWRLMTGSVGQEPVLFSTSIYNNIVYGARKPDLITLQQVENAADSANALEFIRSFPEGFDTIVGEANATMLSGGQKQAS